MVKHARLDPHHRQDLYDLLDRLALSPEQSTVIGINAMQTVTMAAAALREVLTWPDRPAATDARDSATLVPVGV